MSDDGLSNLSMLELFRLEVDGQASVLTEHLLELEQHPQAEDRLEGLMRAAHSIKGAARMVDIAPGVKLAHLMEDVFVAAQEGRLQLDSRHIDTLLGGVDMLKRIAEAPAEHFTDWLIGIQSELDALMRHVTAILSQMPDESQPKPPAATAVESTPAVPAANNSSELGNMSMLELFRLEVEAQTAVLSEHLLELEQNPADADVLQILMRAAHSIKGAARMVNVDMGVKIAHAMEDCFVAAQNQALTLNGAHIDLMLRGVDSLMQIATLASQPGGGLVRQDMMVLENLLHDLTGSLNPAGALTAGDTPGAAVTPPPAAPAGTEAPKTAAVEAAPTDSAGVETAPSAMSPAGARVTKDTAIRVSTDSLNRLMGLSGEAMVGARWLHPHAESLLQIKRRQAELISVLDNLWDVLERQGQDEFTQELLKTARHKAADCRHALSERLAELEAYDRRTTNLSSRLNREVIASRMRPFADGVHGFQRMARDLSRSLGKQVKLQIRGLTTKVDRDILEKIEAPLNHLLRNSIDHGIETPAQRLAAGKPETGTIILDAVHASGMLSISVQDDGRGIDLEMLRGKIVGKGLVTAETAPQLSETELMEFLFLPSFSTRDNVTETSGRGVGLDVVHNVVQEMRGMVRATSHPGKGIRFQLQLPLTLSVIRALLVEISGESYAIPLGRIERTVKIPPTAIELMEGRQYFTFGSRHIGIVSASQVLGLQEQSRDENEIPVIVIGERLNHYGLIVDRLLGEHNLVVRPLDSRLGKIKDISAAAFMEDGTPSLIVDVDDLLRSIDILVAGERLDRIQYNDGGRLASRKRVLVVDDSITIREVERNMLETRGYQVDVAVDGMDGWNAVRTGHYDLVISDIDMPRMNGLEFVGLIKKDSKLKNIPVMIVSYKDREEDRHRGLEAGADYYITKGSFHDETLLTAVQDLIGSA
jgi:two-component system sensor histidine kinase and response regulator WspE